MAMTGGRENVEPGARNSRFLDGLVALSLCVTMMVLCDGCILMFIIPFMYIIFAIYSDSGKRSDRYYVQFRKLSDKTRLRWRVGVWSFIVLLLTCMYMLAFCLKK